jgi:hypothetical protein
MGVMQILLDSSSPLEDHQYLFKEGNSPIPGSLFKSTELEGFFMSWFAIID